MSWGEVKKINSDLNTPLNEGGVKIVKSVQRGISNGSTTSIAISEVNPDKCLVILNGSILQNDAAYMYGVLISSLTSTSLSVRNPYTTGGSESMYWSWQVIEFY